MPLFQYTANDESGRRVEGMLQGADWKEVDGILSQRGLKLTGIAEIQAAQAQTTPSHQPSSQSHGSAPQTSAQQTSQPRTVSQSPSAPARVVNVAQKPPRRKTAWASDKDTMFLFSQVASYLRSGINPHTAYSNLSRSWQTKYAEALTDMAHAATEGRSVADEMERFPFLFQPHVVGLYRAGETGGFLPEVCDAISKQAEESRRFKFWYKLLNWIWWSSVACFPVVMWGANGLLGSWDRMEATGGSGNGFEAVGQGMGDAFLKVLPLTVGMIAIVLIGAYVWQSTPLRPLRHRLTLFVPTTGKRARLESMALFSWVLGRLFEVGIAPKSALTMAAASMPNIHLADEMGSAASNMRSETPVSQIVDQVKLLSPEMKVMVKTGEMVGDLPGQLNNVYRAQRDEFVANDKMSRFRIGCWMILIFFAASLIFYGLFWRMFYDGIFKRTVDAPLDVVFQGRALRRE